MPFKGYKQSKEHKRKISEALKGENNFMFGRKHTEEARRKISEATKGEKHPRWGKRAENSPTWKGGKLINTNGYIRIYQPSHPYADKNNYVLEHRLIAEKELGRYLKPTEEMHHRNGNRNDNRWDNLFVFESKPDHIRYERFLRRT